MCASMAWCMLRAHEQAVHASTLAVGQGGGVMLGLASTHGPIPSEGFPCVLGALESCVCPACVCCVLGLQVSPTLQAQQH